MAKINLFFDKFEDEDNPGYAIIRLKCGIQLKKEKGWSLPYTSVIDTGAHTSVLPLSVWQELSVKKIKPYKIYGISKDERCGLSGMLGEITIILIDEKGNQSSEINAIFFLAETDQVPIIIGFKGLLEKLRVTAAITGNAQFKFLLNVIDYIKHN